MDINPKYIEQTRLRYGARIPGLQLYVADIQTAVSLFEPVDLIYAALLFEYVDVSLTMNALWRHCNSNGILAAVSQLPHETMNEVSPSPYTSLSRLKSAMRLVPPEELRQRAEQAGFDPEQSSMLLSPSGKRFSVDVFRRRARAAQWSTSI